MCARLQEGVVGVQMCGPRSCFVGEGKAVCLTSRASCMVMEVVVWCEPLGREGRRLCRRLQEVLFWRSGGVVRGVAGEAEGLTGVLSMVLRVSRVVFVYRGGVVRLNSRGYR